MSDAAPTKAVAAINFKNVTITSDGSVDGTVIKVNGEPVKNLVSFSFSMYDDGTYESLNLGFSTREPSAAAGQLNATTYFSLVPLTDKANATQATATLRASNVVPANHLPPADSDAAKGIWTKV